MTRFFIPSFPAPSGAAEDAYGELRDRAEACTGAVASERRIELVQCRVSGRDCLLQVGQPDAATGQTVAAIIKVGRGTYTVHHVGPGTEESPDPLVLPQSAVYSITDFE